MKKLFGTLRSRIFVALLIISMVPIAALGIQGYHCAMQAVVELAQKHLLAVADARRTVVEGWLEERTRSIETLGALPTTRDLLLRSEAGDAASQSRIQELLDTFQRSNPFFEGVSLYKRDWTLIARTEDPVHNEQTPSDAAFRTSVEKAGKPFLSAVHKHLSGDIGLHVGFPVRASDERAIGFLVGNINLTKSLTPLLQERAGLYRTGKVYIVSNDMDVLTQPTPGEQVAVLKREGRSEGYGHMAMQSEGVSNYRDYRGNLVLGADIPIGFHSLSGFDKLLGWRLIAEIDSDEALGWLRVLLIRASATGLVTCMVVLVIAAWISRLVGKPLRELMRVAFRIRAGHTDERLEQMDVAEAEEVRQAFNAMLDELRQKQDELVKTATLAYVGELTSSTVHEMRNPLSSIKMNLQALSRAVDQNGRYKELGEIALEQTRRLEQMLTDLLNFGRPVKLATESLPFGELAQATLEVTAEAAVRNQVTIDVENHLDGLLLRIDKEQMCRALTNLVSNAIDAMPSGGRVLVTATEHSGEVELSVQDTGPGLSSEALQRALQPFYTTKPNGTGLGLPNVKKIVELHGGKLLVENRPGGGAIFRLVLPAKCVTRA